MQQNFFQCNLRSFEMLKIYADFGANSAQKFYNISPPRIEFHPRPGACVIKLITAVIYGFQ